MRRVRVPAVLVAVVVMGLTACKTPRQASSDAAIAQAKALAAQTGVAQQVVWTDVAGNRYTVVVQPPLPGHSEQTVTKTVGKEAGDPRVLAPVTNSPQEPVISPVKP